MDASTNYLCIADIGLQQIARLMRGPRLQAFADDVNRLERSAQ
jgi:hypothetical protein